MWSSLNLFGAFGSKRQQGDVGRCLEPVRHVAASLVDDQDGMGNGTDCAGDLGQIQVHGVGDASRQHHGCAFAQIRADRPEDMCWFFTKCR